MARIYPLTIGFTEAIGPKENHLSFASLRLVDLRNSQSRYLSTMKQLIDALPKTEDPASRFALRGHIARTGQPRLRHSMRAALWFLLPSDGTFLRDSSSLRYYLARQGRHAALRGGDVILSLAKYIAELLKRPFICCCLSGERCSGTGGCRMAPGLEVEDLASATVTTSRTPIFCPECRQRGSGRRLWIAIHTSEPLESAGTPVTNAGRTSSGQK